MHWKTKGAIVKIVGAQANHAEKTRAHSPEEALAIIKKVVDVVPAAAVVTGSGVSVLNDLKDPHVFPFREVFGVAPTVAGHSGELVVGRLAESESTTVAVIRGRYHVYEGHDWSVVTLTTRTLIAWGVPRLILTNAAGGINSSFNVGDLMAITGFRDFLSEKGRGELIAGLKQPPVDCRNELLSTIIKAGEELANSDREFRAMRQGVYAAFTGPSYETLSEISMVRKTGCDAVGMSTVPELLTARPTALQAAAISVITNVWREDITIGGHEEVLEASKAASRRLDKLFRHILSLPVSRT
jgi:purine-nucleoside phosphorylase